MMDGHTDMTAATGAGGAARPPQTGLPDVRRLEAVSFRSWPASTTSFDGTWAIRLTAGHPSKRLNSVNPLDRADHADLENRIARMGRKFASFGRPLVFRQTPLAPTELENILDARGWRRFDETIVMTRDLTDADETDVARLPVADVGRWIDACIAMGSVEASVKPGLSELIAHVEGQVGLFLIEDDAGTPLAAAMAVRFADMAGLFEIVANPSMRRHGFGRMIVGDAMAWAKSVGARRAWLQVVSDNAPARALYGALGFEEGYRYAYRQAPDGWKP